MSGQPNKRMKLTKPERNGALQLIPGVRRTLEGKREWADATPPTAAHPCVPDEVCPRERRVWHRVARHCAAG